MTQKPIGKGTFGNVYSYKDKNTGIRYAAKQHHCPDTDTSAYESSFLKEIDIMRKFNSPYILPLVKFVFENKCKIDIVMPLMDGSLHDFLFNRIKDGSWVTPVETRGIFAQLAHGLNFLHANGIWHNDVKFANCLYKISPHMNGTENMSIMWSDFGSTLYDAWKKPRTLRQLICSGDFRPPEVMESSDYKIYPTTDVWSLGMMLFYMVSDVWYNCIRKQITTEVDDFRDLFQASFLLATDPIYREKMLHQWSPDNDVYTLLSGCLVRDPLKRITTDKVLANKYVIPTTASQSVKPIQPVSQRMDALQILRMKKYLDGFTLSDVSFYLFGDICHRCTRIFNDNTFLSKVMNIVMYLLSNALYGHLENVYLYEDILRELDGYIYRPFIYDALKYDCTKSNIYRKCIYMPDYMNIDVSRL